MTEDTPRRKMKGIVFDRERNTPVTDEWDGQFSIAALESPGVEVSYQTTFQPDDTDGRLSGSLFAATASSRTAMKTGSAAARRWRAAIAVRFTLKPGEKRVVPMVISWDMPVVEFGAGRKWYRHYTNFYGTSGTNAWKIAKDGLHECLQLEQRNRCLAGSLCKR